MVIGSRLLTSEWAPYLSRSAIFLLSCSGSPQLFMLPRIASSNPAGQLFLNLLLFSTCNSPQQKVDDIKEMLSQFLFLHSPRDAKTRLVQATTLYTVHTPFIDLFTVLRTEALLPLTDKKMLWSSMFRQSINSSREYQVSVQGTLSANNRYRNSTQLEHRQQQQGWGVPCSYAKGSFHASDGYRGS